MATDELVVKITGRDGLTQTFTAVGKAGRAAGTQIEQGAKQGAAGLKQLDEASKRSARSFEGVTDGATKVGAAVGLAVGVLGKLGQASVSEANSIRSLGLAYGTSAKDVLDFTEALQDSSNFSNDAARQAALLGSTLTREYGLTTQQAELLVQRSADLAQVYGFALPDAMNRSASAVRGEAEAAESMGVAMADSVLQAKAASLGIDNWTTSATEAEKAGVRFDEFMRQTAFVDGSAALAAETTAGKVAHLKNELQDAATSVGGFLGPVGEATSQLSTYGFALAGAATGLQVLRQAQVALNLSFLGPVGLAAAAVAAGVALYSLTRGEDEYEAATSLATDSTESLTEAVLNLGQVTRDTTLLLQAEAIAKSWDLIDDKIVKAGETYNEWKANVTPEDLLPPMEEGDTWDLTNRYGELTTALEAEDAAQRAATLSADQLADAHADLLTVIGHTGPGAAQAQAVILEMIDDFNNGTITAQQLAVGVDIIANSLNAYDEQAIKAAGSTTTLTGDIEEQTAALLAQAGALSDVNEIYGTLRQAGVEQSTQTSRQVQLWLDEQRAIDAQNEAVEHAVDVERLRNHVVADSIKGGNDLLSVLDALRVKHGEVAPAVIAATATLDAERDAIVGLITDLGQMPTLFDVLDDEGLASFVTRITGSMQALDTAISVVIDGTERLGAGSANLDQWATDLIGVQGEASTLDDLLSRSVITLDEYNRAQQAQVDIAYNNAAIQDDLLSVQVQQADFLADQTIAQAAYVDWLEKMPAAQQRVALGFLDAAEAAKLNDAILLAATASQNGYTEAASASILTLAEQDSVFRDMALSVGLLRYETDEFGKKQLVVNFEGADSLQSTIDDLTESIDLLTDAILGVPPGTTWRFHAEGTEEIRAAQQALTDLYAIASQRIPDADFTRFIQAPASRGLPTPPAPTGPAYPRAPASLPLPAPPPVTTPGMRGVAGGYVASAPLAPPPMAASATFDAGEAMAGLAMLKDRLSELQLIQLDIEPTIDVELVRRGFKSIGDGAETINDLDIEPVVTANTRPFDQGALSVFRASAALDSTSSTVSVGLVGAGGVINGLASVQNMLNALNGRTATTYVQTIYTTGGAPGGLGEAFQHGGLVSPEAIARAQHGLMPGGQYSWVGEAGRELVKLPQGSLVTPHTASMAATKGRGGAGTINNYGTIHVSAPNADVASAIGSYFRGQGR